MSKESEILVSAEIGAQSPMQGPVDTRATVTVAVPIDKGSLTGRAAVLALVFGLLVITLTVPVRSWFDQRADISALETEVAVTRSVVAEKVVMQERWNDPAFIIAEARRRLHFLLPGEIGYTTIGADGLPIAEATSPPVPASGSPWYETLWSAVQVADKPCDPLASVSQTGGDAVYCDGKGAS